MKNNQLHQFRRVYVASIIRILNAYVFPFDFRRWAEESLKVLEAYQAAGENLFDFSPALEEIGLLHRTLSQFYSKWEKAFRQGKKEPQGLRKINQCLLELGRILIPTDYTRAGRYSHDPAVPIPSFPGLEPIRQLPLFSPDGNEHRFLQAQLLRERNKVIDALKQARRVVERYEENI